ncbi:TetR/AcrR family transcriptional regulator [Agromyces sp. NPDC056965]|uniref:TetR/AcrR family transcriptional regulator n=1 Tax=Agromyces sp. NPDC056965 TaxID=3345983 RepID=UPI00362AADA4
MSNNQPARLSPEQRRDQILDVATRYLSHSTYDSMSMQAIAAEAGVTRALVHHYFGGKDGLYDAVVAREVGVLLELTALDPSLSPEQNLDRALGAYFDYFSSTGGELRRFYASVASAPKHDHPVADAHLVQIDRIIGALGVPDSPRNRIAVAAWLTFVVEAANESAARPEVTRDDVLSICRAALRAAVSDTPT